MAYYLLCEAVNLANFIFDVEDLSTARGGGLLLLDSSELVCGWLNDMAPGKIVFVNSGASMGLFRMDVDERKAGKLREYVANKLATDAQLRHATFTVDITEETQDFAADRARMMAKNRWQQMQTMSLVYPDLGSASHNNQWVCTVDKVRPAALPWSEKEAHSASVHARHKYGRDRKNSFYKRELSRVKFELKDEPEFVNDFDKLAASSPKVPGALANKMAVIYLDGNGFGSLFREKCKTWQQQQRASYQLRKHQAEFLGWLLKGIQSNENESWLNAGKIRLETLLWGGDEIILVVPAWKGWYVLSEFYEHSKNWRVFEDDTEVTHCAGIVYCHYKCHIHAATRLAHELVEVAKAENKKSGRYGANRFMYQVLESFDHIGEPLSARYLRRQYSFVGEIDRSDVPNGLVLDGEGMKDQWNSYSRWREMIPRRKIHEILRAVRSERTESAKPIIAETLKKLGLSEEPYLKGEQYANWHHFGELWDYVGFEAWPMQGEK